MTQKCDVAIIGGGTGGIAVAAQLIKRTPHKKIVLIEPSETHYYQPGWTFVGAGIYSPEQTARPMQTLIPEGCTWLRERVQAIEPESNQLTLGNGEHLDYEYLVVAAGIRIDWDGIPGLQEAIGHDGVVSNYGYDLAPKTWDTIRHFQGGTAIFTQPKPPFKCPGAAQKILYLADDAFRKQGVRKKTQMIFCSAAPGIFPVKKFADPLQEVIKRKELDMRYQTNLVAVDGPNHKAIFVDAEGKESTLSYDMLHVTPPMSAPDFLKGSSIANAGGWVDVDKYTLQHKQYSNIFGLGDCTNTPNSKTAAAIKSQTPVLVSNLTMAMNGQQGIAAYDGYASCPLVTGYGKLVLAEFDYNLQPKETFPFDQGKERRSMFWLKKYILPKFYWDVLLKGGTLNAGGD